MTIMISAMMSGVEYTDMWVMIQYLEPIMKEYAETFTMHSAIKAIRNITYYSN